jgi:hypothetical protein
MRLPGVFTLCMTYMQSLCGYWEKNCLPTYGAASDCQAINRCGGTSLLSSSIAARNPSMGSRGLAR